MVLPLLSFVPAATSLILGIVYVLAAEARPAVKLSAIVVFLVAVYLQFFSSHTLAGLLVQISLAVVLAIWHRMNVS